VEEGTSTDADESRLHVEDIVRDDAVGVVAADEGEEEEEEVTR
jgi:hypothetical protein